MTIIHRRLLLNFLRNLAYTMVGALILFTMIDMIDHSSSFLDNNATLAMITRYYMYKSAWIVDTVLPIAMLMATLFTVGAMARYLELTALFAAGWSLMRVGRPLIVLGLLMTLVSLVWREYVLPQANVNRNRVWEVEIHGNTDLMRPTEQIAVTNGDGRLYFARRFDPTTSILTGLKIISYKGSAITERIDVQRAEWDGERWTLINGIRRRFLADNEVTSSFNRLKADDLTLGPEGFYRDRIRQEDMNIRQLREYISLVERSGGDPTKARVDIQFNFAFPLVNLIVVLLGLLLASGPRKTTIASGFGWTLAFGFGYYLFMNFGRTLGHNGTLPPLPAAWAGNVLYAAIVIVLFLRARR